MSLFGLRAGHCKVPPSTAADAAPSPPECPASAWTPVARSAALEGPGPFALIACDAELVALRTSRGLRAYSDRCPHEGALLSEGEFDGRYILCRNHRKRFDAETGESSSGSSGLRPCPIVERGGMVFVRTDDVPRARSAIQRRTRTIVNLPGPRGLPLVGNLLDLDGQRLHLVLEDWAQKHGPVYRFKLGTKNIVVVSDATISHEILKDRPDGFRRIPNTERIADGLRIPGIFSAEGASWRALRQPTAQALSMSNVQAFGPTILELTEKLHRRWQRAAALGVIVDPADDFRRFAADLTMRMVFGYDAGSLDGEHDPVREKLELIFPFVARRLKAVVPYWRVMRLPADRRVDRAVDDVRAWLSTRVAEARLRGTGSACSSEPRTLLELMLDADDGVADDVVLGNLVQVLLAGEDTTANTLAWVVHELCDDERTAARVRSEVDAALRSDRSPASLGQLEALHFTSAVANETLRLRPVVPILFMQSEAGTVLGDLRVPRGTEIWLLRRPPGLDGNHFAEPRAFRPERWLDPRAAATRAAATHHPFGAGPRVCPGRLLANTEIRAVLSMIHRNFTVERVGRREEVAERFVFTLHPRGLRVRISKRAGS